MEVIVLIIHLLVCVCLIGLVLLQRSEGGALGMGGGSGSLMSGRGAADALAKMTQVAGAFFLVTSLSLTFLSGAAASSSGTSVFDRLRQAPASAPAPTTPPAAPEEQQNSAPDPTQSSNEATTQLASVATPAPVEVAPAPADAATRAAPLSNSAAAPPQRAASEAEQRPAVTQPASAQSPRPPARSATQTTSPAAEPRLVIPNTSGAVSGVNLSDDDPSAPESIQIGNGVEAVRRQRAGPDQ